MKNMTKFLSLALLAITLTACQTWEAFKEDVGSIDWPEIETAQSVKTYKSRDEFLTNGDCPTIELVNELSLLSLFKDPQKTTAKGLSSTVSLSAGESTCEYNGKSVQVDLTLIFAAELGPMGREDINMEKAMQYPYFVAVTDETGKVLAKEIFTAPLTFEAGKTTAERVEKMRQIIPVENRSEGRSMKVITGFQLNKDQLAYNRNIIEAQRIAEEKRKQAEIEAQKAKEAAEKAAKEKAEQDARAKEIMIEKANPMDFITDAPEAAPENMPSTDTPATSAGPIDITNP